MFISPHGLDQSSTYIELKKDGNYSHFSKIFNIIHFMADNNKKNGPHGPISL
jgi:hypothetical protein